MTKDLIARAREALEHATPGPWSLSKDTCYSGRMSGSYYRVWDNDLNAICAEEYGAHNDGGKANMHLIALSPDLARLALAAEELAEALKAAKSWVERMHPQGFYAPGINELMERYDSALTAFNAIAKGEQT